MIHLCIVNQSVLPDSQVKREVAAVQIQVSRDFKPVWGIDAKLRFSKTPRKDEWVITVLNDTDEPTALGYHDCDDCGKPFGKVFALTALKDASPVSVVLSHETLEILANPSLNECEQDGTSFYAHEVADPVEADTYEIGGIPVSDFVTPAWFVQGMSGPYDHLKKLSAPFTLSDGGYISILEFGEKRWKPIFGDKIPPVNPTPGPERHGLSLF